MDDPSLLSETSQRPSVGLPSRKRHGLHPFSLIRSLALRPRIYLAVAAALIVIGLLPRSFVPDVRMAIAWDAGGLVYLAVAFYGMATVGTDTIRRRAARQDDGRLVILVLILTAIVASFAAIFAMQGTIKSADQSRGWLITLAAFTIVVSWLVTQVVFALHYAHDYYRPDDPHSDAQSGLVFPGTDTPDYWDFLYFSTSIGATSQTSDVAIRSRVLRRIVTAHCCLAFLFNTSVLALTINMAAAAVGN